MVKSVREYQIIECHFKDYYLLALTDLLGHGILEFFERVKQLSSTYQDLLSYALSLLESEEIQEMEAAAQINDDAGLQKEMMLQGQYRPPCSPRSKVFLQGRNKGFSLSLS